MLSILGPKNNTLVWRHIGHFAKIDGEFKSCECAFIHSRHT
jgi:hypothetical protein